MYMFMNIHKTTVIESSISRYEVTLTTMDPRTKEILNINNLMMKFLQ